MKSLSAKDLVVEKFQNSLKIRIPDEMIYKDEDGKVLSQSESKKMLDSRVYFPNIDTKNKTVILKKK